MTPERWQQVDKLLEQALEHDPSQRRVFLDEACLGDGALRREVESLLSAHGKAEGFTEAGPMRTPEKRMGAEGRQLLTGRQVGHYQILSHLGEGGMGIVYKARDTLLGRTVALKVLPPELVSDPERKRRFVQEAKAASSLNHPNIITVYDVVDDEGVDFIVMEYVAGQTLAGILASRRVALDDALKYGVQIASALAAAHRAGVIHRDLKPGNIMVDGQGVVKVVDFGLAKVTAKKVFGTFSDTQSTQTNIATGTKEGTILGTVCYMSPEQAEGKPVDTRSDIFSFGALLYELLTRRRAFEADSSLAILTAILREDPKPASSMARGIPPELDRIVERCLRKDPERRFQSAADLSVVLQDLQEELRREKPAARAALPARHWFWAGISLVLLAVVCWALWLARTPKSGTKSSLRIVPLTSYPGIERSPSFSPDGKQVAFSWNGENQDNEDIYAKPVGTESRLRLTDHPGEDFSPVWSPDGRSIAFLRRVSGHQIALLLISPVGGRARPLCEFRHPVTVSWHGAQSWSPDNQWLAVPDQPTEKEPQGLFLVSVETGEKRRLTSCPPFSRGDYTPAFSPDGQTLAFARIITEAVSDLYLLPLSRELIPAAEPTRLTFENRRSISPVWISDGSELLFVSGGQHHPGLWKVPVSGRARPESLPLGGGGVYLFSPALSRHGDLAFVHWISDVNIWRVPMSRPDRKAGEATALISSSFLDHTPQFSPDGQKIAFASYRSGHAEIWICDSNGSNAFQLSAFAGPDCSSPRWSPDGKQIAFGANQEGQGEVYAINAEGGKARRLTIHPADDGAPSWSQDGKWIYFTSNRTGTRQVWKMPAQGGDATQVTKQGGGNPMESPDGRYVYCVKSEESVSSLWRISADGVESRVLDVYASSYAVVRDGVYFIPPAREGRFTLHFLSFSTGKTSQLASLAKQVQYGFSVSPDERWILYPQTDHRSSDLMLVENFR